MSLRKTFDPSSNWSKSEFKVDYCLQPHENHGNHCRAVNPQNFCQSRKSATSTSLGPRFCVTTSVCVGVLSLMTDCVVTHFTSMTKLCCVTMKQLLSKTETALVPEKCRLFTFAVSAPNSLKHIDLYEIYILKKSTLYVSCQLHFSEHMGEIGHLCLWCHKGHG